MIDKDEIQTFLDNRQKIIDGDRARRIVRELLDENDRLQGMCQRSEDQLVAEIKTSAYLRNERDRLQDQLDRLAAQEFLARTERDNERKWRELLQTDFHTNAQRLAKAEQERDRLREENAAMMECLKVSKIHIETLRPEFALVDIGETLAKLTNQGGEGEGTA